MSQKLHQLNKLLAYLTKKVIKSHIKLYVIVVLLIFRKVPYFR
jgi:hypothetical protein